tara:strand:+ start:1461 stop:3107 length:1647 start_codon:yes stop_codon:yes gene_type:complete
MNSIIYIFFYLFLYFLGRGVFTLFTNLYGLKSLNYKIASIPINIFYPIISLFYIGNLILVFNFFTGTNKTFIYLIGVFPILLNFSNMYKLSYKVIDNVIKFIILFIVGLSTNTITFHQDAASYHLAYQNFIRSEKIVLGMSNLHIRYGFSSISEYINSFFWLENNFLLVHFVNLIFVTVYYFLLFWILKYSDDSKLKLFSILVLFYGLLDNFGLEGGKNGYFEIDLIGKQDSAFGIMYLATNLFIYLYLIKLKTISKFEFSVLLFFTLFTIQLKLFGFTLLIGILLLITKYENIRKIKIYLPPFIIGLIWSLKNFLISSCFIFPIEITCFNSKWLNNDAAKIQSLELRTFHNSYDFLNETPISFYINWTSRYINFYMLINFLLSLLIILFILITFFKFNKKYSRYNLLFIFYFLVLVFMFLISAPTIRFGYGLFLMFFLILQLFFEEKRLKKLKNYFSKQIITMPLLILVVLTTPLAVNYELKLENIQLKKISPPEITYTKNEGYGYRVNSLNLNDLQFCWLNIECLPKQKNNLEESYFRNYKIFYFK